LIFSGIGEDSKSDLYHNSRIERFRETVRDRNASVIAGLFSGGGAERLIADSRLVLSAVALLAIWLDSTEPARFAHATYVLMSLYVVFAGTIALVLREWPDSSARLAGATHAVDLAVSAALVYLAEGANSPFFAFFTFALIAATVRWRVAGALATAAVALAAFIGIGVYAVHVLHDPDFELNRFVIRAVYLAVVAVLLGSLGAHEERVHRRVAALADWPSEASPDSERAIERILGNSALVLGGGRAAAFWEEPGTVGRRFAAWSEQEAGGGGDPPLREPAALRELADRDFLLAGDTVLESDDSGRMHRLRPRPEQSELAAALSADRLVGLRLRGEHAVGWLFVLDVPRPEPDDLVAGRAVARHAATRMDWLSAQTELARAAALAERLRLAREIHDGVLQSLAGASLQIEGVRSAVPRDPAAAEEGLARIQAILFEEQKDLRFFLRELQPGPEDPAASDPGLGPRLEAFCRRLEAFWGVEVVARVEPSVDALSPALAREAYRLVQEALVNSARHARARRIEVSVAADGPLRMVVADDGRGFSFAGRYDLAELDRRRLGPVSLKARVRSLNGELWIDSSDRGARVEVRIPAAEAPA
jgi:signal transduction histidine kinase